MESESLAKIAIRGKGSVKEGKGRSDAAHTSNQEEDLHCLIMADTEEKVNKAKELIHNVIETAASIPEGQNELKRNQLRELAALNGTLRDDENQACQNCTFFHYKSCLMLTLTGGQIGHRKYDCPEQRNFTATVICRVCGNAGHMARDCPERQRGSDSRNNVPGNFGPPRGRLGPSDAVDREMEVSNMKLLSGQLLTLPQNLMQELSGNPSAGPAGRIEAAPGTWDQGDSYGGGGDSRPWARPQASGGAAPWQQRDRPQNDYGSRDGGSGAAPWASRGGSDNYGGGYGGAPGSGAAPWQQQAPPPPPPGQSYGGYGGYQGYDQGGYGGAPPPPAPPGLSDFLQQYGQQPPPPPADIPAPPPYNAPPPPPGDVPPPPPPS